MCSCINVTPSCAGSMGPRAVLRALTNRPSESKPGCSRKVSEGLMAVGVTFDARNVIGHQHALVSDFFVSLDGLDEIDVAIVGEGFLEVQESAADVAEMDVEDFLARAEVADDVVDLDAWILQ